MSPRLAGKLLRQVGSISCHALPLQLVNLSSSIPTPLNSSSTSSYSGHFKFHNSHSKQLDVAETLDFGLKCDAML